MRSGSFLNFIYTLALLAIGMSAGWWLRGALPPPSVSSSDEQQTEAERSQPQWSSRIESTGGPGRSAMQADQWHSTHSPSQTPPQAEPGSSDLTSLESPKQADPASEFRELLAAQSFFAAMDIYRQVERRDSRQAAELKSIVLEYLESYLKSGDDAALTSLVDAFLSDYYDDIDVLLVLARHQFQSDYFSEAARTFQLAFSYSLTQAGGQIEVEQAFQQFVGNVDQHLAASGQWQELTRFYESLQQLDLTKPEYQLRQAQLYLDHGEATYGYELLQRLSAEPTVAAEANAMLDDGRSVTRDQSNQRRTPPIDAIALDIIGSHYHLPLRLNNSLNISLLIDTGASVTTLSRERFDAIRNGLQLTELGPQIFNTAGGTAKGTMYQAESVQLGRHTLNDIHIAVLDFDMPEGVDGLLGMNVLRHFRFEVDQDRSELQLQPRP